VLDLGCGTGELLYMCQTIGCSAMTGVDLCKEELEIAKESIPGRFVHADILEYLSETDEVFDWIGAMNILEHLDKDTLLEVLKLSRARLAPGGVLVAMVPNAISPAGSLTRHWDLTHEWAFTPNNFRQLAPLSGFSGQIDLKECGPVPHGFVSGARWVLWQGIRLLIFGYYMIEVANPKERVYTMDMLVRLHRGQ